jgi:hypothetical protein
MNGGKSESTSRYHCCGEFVFGHSAGDRFEPPLKLIRLFQFEWLKFEWLRFEPPLKLIRLFQFEWLKFERLRFEPPLKLIRLFQFEWLKFEQLRFERFKF